MRSAALDDLSRHDSGRALHFIEIDVERHAAATLCGAHQILAQHRLVVFVSLHSLGEAGGARERVSLLHYRLHNLFAAPISWREALFQTALFTH